MIKDGQTRQGRNSSFLRAILVAATLLFWPVPSTDARRSLNRLPVPPPTADESLLEGTVQTVDVQARILRVKVDSVLAADGTQAYFGNAPVKTVALPPTSPAHYADSAHRWLSLRDVQPGMPVSVYGPLSESGATATRLILPVPDPDRPALNAPEPPGLSPREHDGVSRDNVVVPLVFPILGKTTWRPSFLASRGGGTRRHRGEDIFGPKMLPLVAVFDGVVYLGRDRGNAGHTITLVGVNGWTAQYYHVNNDTPGTDDGAGGDRYAFAPGLRDGSFVFAGQFLGWNGDSGNAERTPPHLHFEIWHQATNTCFDPGPSLRAARVVSRPAFFAPMPDLPVPAGQKRTEVVVRQVDLARRVVVADLLAERDSDGQLVAVTRPASQYLRVGGSAALVRQGRPVESLEALKPGDRATVFAQPTRPGQADDLSSLHILPPPPRPGSLPAPAPVDPNDSPAADATPPQTSTVIIGPSNAYLAEVTQRLLEPVNAFRRARGLTDLVFDSDLARAAQAWSVSMADGDFFDIRDPRTGQTLSRFAASRAGSEDARGYVSRAANARSVGEELVRNHPDLLADPKLTRVGVGHTYLDEDTGRVRHQRYWALVFAPAH